MKKPGKKEQKLIKKYLLVQKGEMHGNEFRLYPAYALEFIDDCEKEGLIIRYIDTYLDVEGHGTVALVGDIVCSEYKDKTNISTSHESCEAARKAIKEGVVEKWAADEMKAAKEKGIDHSHGKSMITFWLDEPEKGK